jgi:hypothetical protein
MVCYDKSNYKASFYNELGYLTDGWITGPTSQYHDVEIYKTTFTDYYYRVWVFKRGTFDLYSDGG